MQHQLLKTALIVNLFFYFMPQMEKLKANFLLHYFHFTPLSTNLFNYIACFYLMSSFIP